MMPGAKHCGAYLNNALSCLLAANFKVCNNWQNKPLPCSNASLLCLALMFEIRMQFNIDWSEVILRYLHLSCDISSHPYLINLPLRIRNLLR